MALELADRSSAFYLARSVPALARRAASARHAAASVRASPIAVRAMASSTPSSPDDPVDFSRFKGATFEVPTDAKYTMADQPARFAKGKAENNARMLTTDYFDGSFLKDARVLVTGGNRGIGLALVKELVACGANVIVTCRKSNDEIDGMAPAVQVIEGVDVTDTESVKAMTRALDAPVDVLINNAGYFYEPVETIENMAFDEELKMIDICAVGPLRVASALYNAGLIAKPGGKIAMITSQGGSVSWRVVQNPTGHDFGHHMSKSAANMGGVLLAQELGPRGILVQMLHPGFNKTGMTKKYEHIWEVEGAVDASVGAKRVLHEIGLMTPERNGLFINCEDGLQIPW